MKERIIQHSRPTLGTEDVKAASGVVKSVHIAQGDKVKEFEEKLAEFFGVAGAVVTNSGTAALHLGLVAMGVSSKDNVLLPSYVCSAPLNAVYMAKTDPKLCDIELESFNIDLAGILNNKTDDTRAVIVPHMFGNVADLEKIKESGLNIIEDCAHSIGATYGAKMAGSIGRFGICSFYANKMMATGEGGALVSNDRDILNNVRDLRSYDEKENYKLRYNYKMTDIQAAIGLVQLKKLPDMIRIRKQIAGLYNNAFKDMDIVLPRQEYDHIFYRYVIRVKKDVKDIIDLLKDQNILCTGPVYKPLHRYLEMRSGFRKADEAYSTAISIPIYPTLTSAEQKKVITAVRNIL